VRFMTLSRQVSPSAVAIAFMTCSQTASAGSVQPVTPAACERMLHANVISQHPVVPCERLALVTFSYIGFDLRMHDDGRVVVLDAVANYVLNIFDELRSHGFPLAQARLMEEFHGDDDLSIAANNTSAYNDRLVDNTQSISFHAYGVAIDLNPVQNPYISKANGGKSISPNEGAAYERRQPLRPGMAEYAISTFSKFGFRMWGGRWREPIDYQHFQVDREIARRLVSLPAAQAKALFQSYVRQGSSSR
jgi:hypothetical protein